MDWKLLWMVLAIVETMTTLITVEQIWRHKAKRDRGEAMEVFYHKISDELLPQLKRNTVASILFWTLYAAVS